MAKLTIDGLELEVTGSPSWSSGGLTKGISTTAFISAQVRLPASLSISKLDKTNARILLELDNGRTAVGDGMSLAGPLRANGDRAFLRFEGSSAEEQVLTLAGRGEGRRP
jgi:hypothetical protein